MRRRTEAGYANTAAPNTNLINNIQRRNIFYKIGLYQVKDFIVRPLDVVVYNIHSPDQS